MYLLNNHTVHVPLHQGRGVAILNTTDYINECNRQLQDTQYYTKITEDDTQQTVEKVYETVKWMYENEQIDHDTFKFLNPKNMKIRTPQWYLLPKIHKNPPSNTKFVGRPIISACSSPTSRISEFLDYYILPIVKKQPTYIRDTTDFILVILDL